MHGSPLILVTGPARSGKSEWAETLAVRSAKTIIYVATAQIEPLDEEWQSRIEKHRLRRPTDWQTLHVPIDLAQTIQSTSENSCLLVDSLGTWLANLLEQEEPVWDETVQGLLESLKQRMCSIIFVAEEVGWGLVPTYPVGRRFRDRLGQLTRQIGEMATCAYLVTGGYVLNLTTLGIPLVSELAQQ
jgi:adenosylcobinamide kinase/adenosylcobinamide-phosphate guanylyltransferase